jgi:hypothetical protein
MEIMGRLGIVRANKGGGIDVADCADCGWTQVLDFSLYAQGFGRFISDGERYGVFTPGVGWETTFQTNSSGAYQPCDIERGWVTTHIDTIRIDYDATLGLQNPPARLWLYDYPYTNGASPIAQHAIIEGQGQTHMFTINADMDGVGIELNVGLNVGGNSDPGGHGVIKKVTIRGTGDNPFI